MRQYLCSLTLNSSIQVDQFVTSLLRPPGRIRQWRHCADSAQLLYDIAGSRWCGRVGREHRSNHVYYTCRLG